MTTESRRMVQDGAFWDPNISLGSSFPEISREGRESSLRTGDQSIM